MPGLRPRLALLCLLLALPAAAPATAADDFPVITDAERAMTSVPGEPGAPAVVLFKDAELQMLDPERQEVSSRLHVAVRLKILTEEGKRYGEVINPHSEAVRLQSFIGRTVLPDGRVVPLPQDAVFRRRQSATEREYVTSAAFPAVEVGAIIDYQYDLRFDSIFYMEPWYFQDRLPVLHSEIVYHIPKSIGVRTWGRETIPGKLKSSKTGSSLGTDLKIWMDDAPAVPEEAGSFPFADMATRFMIVPSELASYGQREHLLDSWESTCRLVQEYVYEKPCKGDRRVRDRARDLVPAAARKDAPAAATTLFRFVRDEIGNEEGDGIWVSQSTTLDAILERGRATPTEKALILLSMLDALKLDATLVWASNRSDGVPDTQVANPNWFNHAIVRISAAGKETFLDPSDRGLAPGQLPPGLQGMPALLVDRKKPQVVRLPASSFEENRRQAVVDLTLDPRGSLSGTGKLTLGGAHAWRRIAWRDSPKETAKGWQDWLEQAFPGYKVEDLAYHEAADDRRVEVTWKLSQSAEEALGDEASLKPSRPLGPVTQLYTLPVERRRTPVLIQFPDRDEVELHLAWPEGWTVESLPKDWSYSGAAGAVASHAEVDAAARRLTYTRRVDVTQRESFNAEQYTAIRDLFGEAEKDDAQSLVLSRGH